MRTPAAATRRWDGWQRLRPAGARASVRRPSRLPGQGDTLARTTGPVTGLQPNPLAGTGAAPLDNSVGTEAADFKPVTSQALTGPVAQAQAIGSVPVVGQVMGLVSQR
ncbi:hypothetical protein [Streptomyces sp. enrichment culture]|uniref:hypothetical protein n=1 Tax=Streptomyces sp. enrichment culture TaxID=1795815 RepID=UPI003F555E3A